MEKRELVITEEGKVKITITEEIILEKDQAIQLILSSKCNGQKDFLDMVLENQKPFKHNLVTKKEDIEIPKYEFDPNRPIFLDYIYLGLDNDKDIITKEDAVLMIEQKRLQCIHKYKNDRVLIEKNDGYVQCNICGTTFKLINIEDYTNEELYDYYKSLDQYNKDKFISNLFESIKMYNLEIGEDELELLVIHYNNYFNNKNNSTKNLATHALINEFIKVIKIYKKYEQKQCKK